MFGYALRPTEGKTTVASKRGRARERGRAEAAARKAAARRAAARKKVVLLAAGAVVVFGAVAAVVILQSPAPGLAFPDQGNLHLEAIDQPHEMYNSRPPSSGPHLPSLANWGESDTQVPPELYVHNLEDGGVVLAYSCLDCLELIDGLRATLHQFDGRRLLMTPYDDIVDPAGAAYRAAAVAWGRVLYFDELDEATQEDLERFVRTFEGLDHHVGASTPFNG
jgi:hypothetical protein